MQLAADEGKIASHAAAVKLLEMNTRREQYVIRTPTNAYYPGFTAMFRVISGVGDKEQEPVIAQFLNDKESWIAYYANQAYPEVKAGIPWKWRTGY